MYRNELVDVQLDWDDSLPIDRILDLEAGEVLTPCEYEQFLPDISDADYKLKNEGILAYMDGELYFSCDGYWK